MKYYISPKSSDDTYLIVLPVNSHTIKEELSHIASWSKSQNLNLNASKTREMIVYRQRSKPDAIPAEIQRVQRVEEMKILGVIVSENSSFKTHLDAKLKETAQGLYALKVLKTHGLKNENLWDITKATLFCTLYASPRFSGALLTLKLNIDYKLHCKNWLNLDSFPKTIHPLICSAKKQTQVCFHLF